MTGNDEYWNWDLFLQDVIHHFQRFSGSWKDLFDVLTEAEQIWREVVEREAGIDSERPQDFVAAILATQSFRIALGDLLLQTSGYSDEAVGLDRTLDDIWLRLTLLSREPKKAAFGFYYAYVCLEIDVMKMLLAQADSDNDVLLDHLRQNLERLEEYRHQVRRLIGDEGYRTRDLKRDYGRINLAETARSIDPETGRRHRFRSASQSGYIHARGFGIDRFIISYVPNRVYSIGPVYDALTVVRIRNALAQLLANLEMASRIVGLEGVNDRVSVALLNLGQAFDRIMKEPGNRPRG